MSRVQPKIKVQLSACSRSFGQERVLESIDLQVVEGEFVALIGASGCGKSTLLRLVAGLDQPTSGSVHVDGQEPLKAPAVSNVSQSVTDEASSGSRTTSGRVSFVFQDAALLPWRSVYANVALPLELSRQAIDRDKIVDLLERVGLTSADAKKLPRQLSGGMRMRVSLARAWVTDPELLLMDEPFGALDDVLRTELSERLSRLCQLRHATVLFVTHQVAEAARLADRVLVMSRSPGRIQTEYVVPFARPRADDLASQSEFHKVVAELHQKLREAIQ